MTRGREHSKLRAWGVTVARRRGAKRARLAVARKLAAIMHRIWVSGGRFETGVEQAKLTATQSRMPRRSELPIFGATCS